MSKEKRPFYKRSTLESFLFILTLSVIITLGLWLIPWMNYAPNTTGRGFPFVWYTKWRSPDSIAQVYYTRLLLDFMITLVFTGGMFFEMAAIKKIRHRKGLR